MNALLEKYETFFTFAALGVFMVLVVLGGIYFTDSGIDRKQWRAVERNLDSYHFERIDMFGDAIFTDDTGDTVVRIDDCDPNWCNVTYNGELVASWHNRTMSRRVAKKLLKKIPPEIPVVTEKDAKKEFLRSQKRKRKPVVEE